MEVLSMMAASFKVSKERCTLENMPFLRKLDDVSSKFPRKGMSIDTVHRHQYSERYIALNTGVDELTSDNTEQFLRSIVTHDDDA